MMAAAVATGPVVAFRPQRCLRWHGRPRESVQVWLPSHHFWSGQADK